MVTNHIAHGFPTGPLDLYEAWLEFQVMDGRGQIIYSIGLIDEAGVLDPNAHQFIAPPITGEGEWIRKHDLWNEYGVAFNNSIPAHCDNYARILGLGGRRKLAIESLSRTTHQKPTALI